MTFSFRQFWKIGSIATIVVFAGMDIAAMAGVGVDATLSRYILGVAGAHPVIPLATGIILGHLFWPQPQYDQAELDHDT